ncbi:MAG: DNA adenine methylase [Oscillospiraceae bacterium]|nr:DNA adenine methylase [Oscillospiraceae bacterium]
MNSPITRIGGKKLLRKHICERFPAEGTFDRYIEVFGGAGWVLFYKDRHAQLEVYNDADGQLVNLMRCIKYHAEELQRELDGYCNAREFFEDASAQLDMRGLTDIQRAARYFLRMKLSFGANFRTFGGNQRNFENTVNYLTDVQKRLMKSSVVIEHKDFENLIKVYDRPAALFYCDPPYHSTEKYYDVQFEKADHIRLRNTLANIKGKFLLSYNDDDFVRELYKNFKIEEIERQNNISVGKFKKLIITNY